MIGTTLLGAGIGAVGGVAAANLCFSFDGSPCTPPSGAYLAEMAAVFAAIGAVSFGVPAIVAHAGVDPLWIGASGAVLGAIGGAEGQSKNALLGALEGAAGGGLTYLAIGYYNRNPR